MDGRTVWSFADEGYVRCVIGHSTKQDQQWLSGIRIYFVLSGHLILHIGTRNYQLVADDLFIINKGELFAVTDGDGISVIYDLNLVPIEWESPELWFNFDPLSSEDVDAAYVLKQFLARFVKFNLDIEQDKTYLNRSLYYAIMHHLISFFRVTKPEHITSNSTVLDRLVQIAKYIDNNYRDPLTLEELSKNFYLSVPYMSKMFKHNFGITFSEYLTNIRLQNSLPELQSSKKTIEEITSQFGFPNSRSYITYFKRKYKITPGEFRRRHSTKETALPIASDRLEVSRSHEMELLAKYLESAVVTGSNSGTLHIKLSEIPACDIRKNGTPLSHNYQKLTSIGCASDILSAENQEMLRAIQKEIGFEYIIFHGLLDDDMMVYDENDKGEPEFNFGYIDMAFDFLLSINLKPFVELSYMPRLLARQGAHFTNSDRSCISLPKDEDKWDVLVQSLVKHLNSKYGFHEVSKWPFTLWNAPDSGDGVFGLGSPENYFKFYKRTYSAVKTSNCEICFCGPSCLTETAEDGSYFSVFLGLCQQDNCLPDMLQYHFYPIRNEIRRGQSLRTELHLTYRSSPDALRESIAKVKSNAAAWPGGINSLHITEWNASISHRELLSDTSFQAAYIVKNILENCDSIESLCYWTLSDSIHEVRLIDKLFHGGLGLFTYNGIKKASYQAFRMLSKLGDVKLDFGEGYFITRNNSGWQIILYNYQHYSQLYADGELFDMTFLNRYTPFVNPVKKKFSISLKGFSNGRYLLTESTLNPSHGSSFDKWIELGALPLKNREDYDYLQSMSLPLLQKKLISVMDGKIDLSLMLEPHEVRLVEISLSYDT